ncbi:MAG: alpha/beta hydrolase [Myxococcales bacterium]|nr:alpha/beta hydrolase [Myxococcales bacterium]
MDRHVSTSDHLRVHYELAGTGDTALVFVHGWLGNATWWNAQRDHFASRYMVAQIDLPGHGRSDMTRTRWSAAQYADDIKAVADDLAAREVVLIGHSMSGAYVCEAAPRIGSTAAVILVDTLKNLEALPSPEQTAQMLELYRKDFRGAVENMLPQYLFSKDTPPEVRARIQREFIAADPALAVQIIEPLYQMDVRAAAQRIAVPVRAINSDYTPTNVEGNRRYFRDYEYETIARAGHYPMLERPDDLNSALGRVLDQLRVSSEAMA